MYLHGTKSREMALLKPCQNLYWSCLIYKYIPCYTVEIFPVNKWNFVDSLHKHTFWTPARVIECRGVKVFPDISRKAPLILNGAPGNIQGNLTGIRMNKCVH